MHSRVSCFGRVNAFLSHVSVYTLAKERLKLHALSWSRARNVCGSHFHIWDGKEYRYMLVPGTASLPFLRTKPF